MQNRLWAGVGMALIGVVAAFLAFFSLLQWQHWRLDEANVHGLVQLVNYNLAQGVLKPLPEAQQAPAPASVPVSPAPPPKP